jgi:hypothetical protein
MARHGDSSTAAACLAAGSAQSAAPEMNNTRQNLQSNASNVKNLQLAAEMPPLPVT